MTSRRSPLHPAHVALGAKMTGFGGWEMPLSFPAGTIAEHLACRTRAVAFDVSHLGTVRLEGPGALGVLQRTLTNDLNRVGPGRAQYTHLLCEDGSVVDDIIVWWVSESRFEVMPNASNTARVIDALGGEDVTSERAVVAIQGPLAREVVSRVAPEAALVERFAVRSFSWEGQQCVAAGTGYTGEDGLECAVPSACAERFWSAILDAGAAPAGLGARDTLRLEAGLPLHGHELGPGITPLQAGMEWVVSWSKGGFRGQAALQRERDGGVPRRLRGLLARGRQPPREAQTVLDGGREVGVVTSGNYSPCLERGIALCLVEPAVREGDELEIAGRRGRLPVSVVRPPFVARSRKIVADGPSRQGAPAQAGRPARS